MSGAAAAEGWVPPQTWRHGPGRWHWPADHPTRERPTQCGRFMVRPRYARSEGDVTCLLCLARLGGRHGRMASGAPNRADRMTVWYAQLAIWAEIGEWPHDPVP